MEKIDFRQMTQDRGLLVATLEDAGAIFTGSTAFKCPFHNDTHASAGIFSDDTGHWRYKCQVCNSKGDVLDLYKLLGKEIIKSPPKKEKPKKEVKTKGEITCFLEQLGQIEIIYKYHTQEGEISFYIARVMTSEGKTMRSFTPCDGGYVWGLPSAPRVLYNLPQVLKSHTVVVVEGEKCADVLGEYGYVSTTSVIGAGNAKHSDWTPLAGKNVILWPDCDDDGKEYMVDVEAILSNLKNKPAISVINPVELELTNKEDVFDFIKQCRSISVDVGGELNTAINKAHTQGPTSSLLKEANLIKQGYYISIDSPFSALTNLTQALIPHTITLICGNPGATKSLVLLQLMRYWYHNKEKAICLELEWDKAYHLKRALAQEAGDSNITNLKWQKDYNKEYCKYLEDNRTFNDRFSEYLAEAEDVVTLHKVKEWITEKAEEGYRVICVDPITIAQKTEKAWVDDERFISGVRDTTKKHNCSVVLVTHPVKMVSIPDMSQISGGAAYGRFMDTIIWLESHNNKNKPVKMATGTTNAEYNRTMHILKSRNGPGQGMRLAGWFESRDLTLMELGIIVRDK